MLQLDTRHRLSPSFCVTPHEPELTISPKNTSILIIDVQKQLFRRLKRWQNKDDLPYSEKVKKFVTEARPHGIHVTWVVLGSEVWSEDHPGEPCCISYDPKQQEHRVTFQNIVKPTDLHEYYGGIFEFDDKQYIHAMTWSRHTASVKRHQLCNRFGITGLGIKKQDDIIVKYREGAFSPKFLDRFYKARNIDTLITFGMNTTACLATSTSQALTRKYRCIIPCELLADCWEDNEALHTPIEQKNSLIRELGNQAQKITFLSTAGILKAIRKNPILPKNKPPSLFFNWSI